MTEQTYWNGEPTPARKISAIVIDKGFFPLYWAKVDGLVGQRINIVEVIYGNRTFYLDDRNGSGWAKVTTGFGSPRWGHRSVDVDAFSIQNRE